VNRTSKFSQVEEETSLIVKKMFPKDDHLMVKKIFQVKTVKNDYKIN